MSSSQRITVFIASIFLSLGIYLPFFPSWLLSKGISTSQIAILLSVPLIVRVLFTPFVTVFAGLLPQRRQAAFLYCLIAFVSFGSLGFVDNFWAMLFQLAIFGAFWHALIPLGDSFALSEVRLHGANYGTIRLWGSIAFVVANVAAGSLLGIVGINGVFVLITVMLMLAVIAAFFLPYYGLTPAERPKTGLSLSGELGNFLKNPQFLSIATSAGLIQASHALIYGFGTINWQQRGYTTTEIGAFWAVGVIAEIVLFTQAQKLFQRAGSRLLLAFGGVAAAARWLLHSEVDGVVFILALQCLHGLSFGATHLGMQAFIAQHVSEEQTPAAQGAQVFVVGILMAGLTFGCGVLVVSFEEYAYFAMALVAAIGLLPLLYTLSPKRG